MSKKILRNMARCPRCGDIIESKYTHDFVQCSCKSIFVDGGKDYLRRGFEDGIVWEDLSTFEENDNKETIEP